MLFAGAYMVNLLCAIVPCQGSMRPPEAHIANTYDSSSSSTKISPTISTLQISNLANNSSNSFEDRNVTAIASSNIAVVEAVRPKRRNNNEPVVKQVNTNRRGLFQVFRQFPNLTNPVQAFMKAFREGVERSGGFTHNFGNPLEPFPDTLPGTIKRDVQNEKSLEENKVFLRNGDAVEGYYIGTMKGKRIIAFQGIPYAEQPVGNLRFKPPVPKRPWNGLLKATRPGSECLQGHPVNFFRLSGSEACLFLNIYTNQTSSSRNKGKLLPVIFFIHGGSFMFGSGAEYGPAYIVDQDVVLVTINYRLGALGFMSTGDSHSRGNFGLKDQALALQWTVANIEQFGGDKNKITIMGQSAGGVSAHIHLIANKTTHLFQNGVSLSGSAFGFWPVTGKKRASGFTKRLAKSLRCPQDNSEKLVECLRRVPANYITGAQLHFFNWIPLHPLVVFAPVVEPEGEDAYLTKSPEELYEAGLVPKKPWIFGQTSQEGHFEIYMINLFFQTPIFKAKIKDLLPVVLDYYDFVQEPKRRKVTEKIMQFYKASQHQSIGDDNHHLMKLVSDMYSDRLFTNSIQKAIRSHGAIAPTYAYIFDYMGKYNLGQVFGASKSEWGVVHTEDLFFYFNSSILHDGFRRSDPEFKLSQLMTNWIGNFARYGEPVYTGGKDGDLVKFWNPAVSFSEIKNSTSLDRHHSPPEQIQYLKIKEVIKMVPDPYVKRTEFWNSLGISL